MLDVVCRDLDIGQHVLVVGLAVLCHDDLTRRGGQADLYGVRVAGQHLRPLAPGRAVALVNDDVAEEVGRVVRGQERGVCFVGVNAERLVGGDVNAGVLGVVIAVAVEEDRRGVGAEGIGQGERSLLAQFVPVTHEQGAFHLPGIVNAFEQVHGDERLPGSGRQGEQDAVLARCDLLQRGANGGILIVAAASFALWHSASGGAARQGRSG